MMGARRLEGITSLPLRHPVIAVSVGVAALGATYALLVPAGLPYDEPSHWQNVLFIAGGHGLPRVGDPRVTYEAVQPPLVYLIDGGFVAVLRACGMQLHDCILAARLLHIGWLIALVPLLAAVLRSAFARLSRWQILVGLAVTAASPVVIAVGSSVQNDIPSVDLALVALLLAFRRDLHPSVAGLLVGVALGLAFLAKASVWPVGVVLVGVALVRRQYKSATITSAVGFAMVAWWLGRNLLLYGSISGTNAVLAGYPFSPLRGSIASNLIPLVRQVIVFLWVPTEYWRDVFRGTWWTDGCIVLACAVVGLAGLRIKRPNADQAVVLAFGGASVAAWAFTLIFVEGIAFRLAYPVLPAWAALVAAASRKWWASVPILAASLSIHVWILWHLAQGNLPTLVH